MDQKEGPSWVLIPEQKYQSCYGCKWYHRYMQKSGMNPVYKQECTHPSIEGGKREIGGTRTAETPDWCPVVQPTTTPPTEH